MEPAKGLEPLTSGLRKHSKSVSPGLPSVTNVKFPRKLVVFCFAGLLSLSPVCVECLSECLSGFWREDGMPRPKTGAAILKSRTVNGKRVKEWYACVSYTDDTGKRQ